MLAAAATLVAGFTATIPAGAAGTTIAQDSFTRTATSGWGSAVTGGKWSSTTGLSVNGAGKMRLAAGQGRSSTLSGISQSGSNTRVTAALDKLPRSGSSYLYVTGRQVGADRYRAKVRIQANGSVRVEASRRVGGAEKTIASRTIEGLKYTAGKKLNVRVQVTGTAPTTVSAKVWASGATEPAAWQATGTDTASSLQKAGSIALSAYLSGSATNAPVTVTYDDLKTVQTSAGGATTTPSSTSTSSSTASSRASLVPGTYKPSASTTGVPDGLKLTPYNTSGADLVITKDGTVLDGLEIWGDIKVRAKNVTIKNSKLHGGKGTTTRTSGGVVDANDPRVVNLVVQDSTIKPQSPAWFRDGIVGHDYTALRNDISNTTDGLGIFNPVGGSTNANVTAKGNYIHDLTFWSYAPNQSDGTHNDGVQVQGGANISLVGNRIEGIVRSGSGSAQSPRHPHATTAVLLQQNVSPLKNVVVDRNYISGGQTSLTVAAAKYPTISVTVKNNRFGHDQYLWDGARYAIRLIKRSGTTVTGLSSNVRESTNTPLKEGRNLGIHYNS